MTKTLEVNRIINDNAFVLKDFPDNSVDCFVTSPPYWGLRDYGLEPLIWDNFNNNNNAITSITFQKEIDVIDTIDVIAIKGNNNQQFSQEDIENSAPECQEYLKKIKFEQEK